MEIAKLAAYLSCHWSHKVARMAFPANFPSFCMSTDMANFQLQPANQNLHEGVSNPAAFFQDDIRMAGKLLAASLNHMLQADSPEGLDDVQWTAAVKSAKLSSNWLPWQCT